MQLHKLHTRIDICSTFPFEVPLFLKIYVEYLELFHTASGLNYLQLGSICGIFSQLPITIIQMLHSAVIVKRVLRICRDIAVGCSRESSTSTRIINSIFLAQASTSNQIANNL